MKRGYVKTSPHFFRLIAIAAAMVWSALVVLALFVPAPLQEPANPALVPNPVKSAWFLLWIQEVVSYSKYLIYPVLALCAAGVLLPWLSGESGGRAVWLHRDRWIATVLTLGVTVGILSLTLVAMFFRGANWRFVLPF